MGGYGSSRWGWTATRTTTDGLLRLDVRDLARRGAVPPRGRGSSRAARWRGRGGGEPAGEIGVLYAGDDPGGVVLDYHIRHAGGPPQPVREQVALARTPCRYGGARPSFLCPGCLSRRAVLYSLGGLFRCRGCHGLAYGSTREGRPERMIRRAAEVRRRLGGKPWPGASGSRRPSRVGCTGGRTPRLVQVLRRCEVAAIHDIAARRKRCAHRSTDGTPIAGVADGRVHWSRRMAGRFLSARSRTLRRHARRRRGAAQAVPGAVRARTEGARLLRPRAVLPACGGAVGPLHGGRPGGHLADIKLDIGTTTTRERVKLSHHADGRAHLARTSGRRPRSAPARPGCATPAATSSRSRSGAPTGSRPRGGRRRSPEAAAHHAADHAWRPKSSRPTPSRGGSPVGGTRSGWSASTTGQRRRNHAGRRLAAGGRHDPPSARPRVPGPRPADDVLMLLTYHPEGIREPGRPPALVLLGGFDAPGNPTRPDARATFLALVYADRGDLRRAGAAARDRSTCGRP